VIFVQEGDAFEARPVVLGRKGSRPGGPNGHLVEVVRGLAPGDRYVGKNSFVLKAELGKSEAGHEH
jgi:cobalt-zinc-cadmium efflux system membrane fusion protein